MALTKSGKVTLYAIASTASNTIDEGSAVDVSTYYHATGRVLMGRGTGTAFTTGPTIIIQGSAVTSGSVAANDWINLAEHQMAVGASIGSQAVSGTEAAGQTTITLAAGTNFAAGDYVFIHNSTIGNSEWRYVQSVSGADIVVNEAIVNAATGGTVRDQAETFPFDLNLVGINALRLVVNGAGSGQAVVVMADFGGVSAL